MKATINTLHHQESDWLRELEFYNQETELLNTRLNEVLPYLEGSIKERVQAYASNFILLKENCRALTKENTERYERINQMAKAVPGEIEAEFEADKDPMNQRMEEFKKLFATTRFEFNALLATVK